MWMNKEPNNIFIGQYDDRIIAVFPVVPWDNGRHSRKLSCKSAPAWSRPIYIPSPSHGPTDIMSVNITATVTVINIMLCVYYINYMIWHHFFLKLFLYHAHIDVLCLVWLNRPLC